MLAAVHEEAWQRWLGQVVPNTSLDVTRVQMQLLHHELRDIVLANQQHVTQGQFGGIKQGQLQKSQVLVEQCVVEDLEPAVAFVNQTQLMFALRAHSSVLQLQAIAFNQSPLVRAFEMAQPLNVWLLRHKAEAELQVAVVTQVLALVYSLNSNRQSSFFDRWQLPFNMPSRSESCMGASALRTSW